MKNKIKDFLQKHINGATIFLVLLIVGTVANSFLQAKILENEVDEQSEVQAVEIRILKSRKGYFNNLIYYAWHDGSIWEIESESYLPLGKKVRAENPKINSFNLSKSTSFEQYQLSIGIAGKIELPKNVLIQKNCDITCRIIQKIATSRNYVQNKYEKTSCHTFKGIVEIFGYNTNCSDVYALSYGLVLGGTEKFSNEAYQNVKLLGLTHLVAVSGFQVVLVLTFIEWLASKISIRKRLQIFLIIGGISVLIFLAGLQPPIIRSGLSMLISWSVLTFLGRRVSSFRSLVYSGILMLWFNPLYIWSISFQLSFLASFALVVQGIGKNDTAWEISWLKNLKSIFSTSLYAFLFTLPIILNISGHATPLSVLTNFIVLPIIPLISVLNILGLIPIIGEIFLAVSTLIESMILSIINSIANQKFLKSFTFFSEEVNGLEMFAYYTILFSTIYLLKNRELFFNLKNSDKTD